MLYGLGSIACGAAVAVYLHRCKGVRFFNTLQTVRPAALR